MSNLKKFSNFADIEKCVEFRNSKRCIVLVARNYTEIIPEILSKNKVHKIFNDSIGCLLVFYTGTDGIDSNAEKICAVIEIDSKSSDGASEEIWTELNIAYKLWLGEEAKFPCLSELKNE